MTLVEIKEWLKEFGLFDHYYIGKINGQQEKVLGIYSRAESIRPEHALGEPSKYQINGVKLLIHWNKYQEPTQSAANQLFKALTDITDEVVGENTIYYVDLQCREPIDVGTDANDIYEYVINLNIWSKRR